MLYVHIIPKFVVSAYIAHEPGLWTENRHDDAGTCSATHNLDVSGRDVKMQDTSQWAPSVLRS
jgi:hypothetical protein